MTLDPNRDLPPGSYAWCSDCPWKDTTATAHVHGKTHSDRNQHLVHVYENESEPPRA